MPQHGAVSSKGRYVVAICLGIASCGRPTPDSSGSLVGANSLPPVAELARETIEINRDTFVDGDRHLLIYELRPNNSLNVKHIVRSYEGDEVVAEESFQVSPELNMQIRKRLWRVRPAKLKGVEYLEFPAGCEPPLDGGMDLAVAFFGQDDSRGVFGLPHACKEGKAATARTVLGEVMRLLPPSRAAEGFPKSD